MDIVSYVLSRKYTDESINRINTLGDSIGSRIENLVCDNLIFSGTVGGESNDGGLLSKINLNDDSVSCSKVVKVFDDTTNSRNYITLSDDDLIAVYNEDGEETHIEFETDYEKIDVTNETLNELFIRSTFIEAKADTDYSFYLENIGKLYLMPYSKNKQEVIDSYNSYNGKVAITPFYYYVLKDAEDEQPLGIISGSNVKNLLGLDDSTLDMKFYNLETGVYRTPQISDIPINNVVLKFCGFMIQWNKNSILNFKDTKIMVAEGNMELTESDYKKPSKEMSSKLRKLSSATLFSKIIINPFINIYNNSDNSIINTYGTEFVWDALDDETKSYYEYEERDIKDIVVTNNVSETNSMDAEVRASYQIYNLLSVDKPSCQLWTYSQLAYYNAYKMLVVPVETPTLMRFK